MDMVSRPLFESLPLRAGGPPGNAWGLYGDSDEIGMLNLLTPERTCEAAKEIVDGYRISVDLPLDKFNTPAFKRQPFHQQIHHKTPRSVNDDILTFNTQSSSQWDGFRHFGYQAQKQYFNGRSQLDFETTNKNGIHAWVEKGGIVGRGVLLDYQSWAEAKALTRTATSTTSITLAELEEVASFQGVKFRRGDILCIRSGYLQAINSLRSEEVAELFEQPNPPAIGVQSSKEMLKWIWDTGFAAVSGDMPSFEAWPCQDNEFFLHEWLLAGWGLPIGELFDFEELAVACKNRNKWSFFFSSMPLKVPGGVASPPNAVAIL